jgi:transposase
MWLFRTRPEQLTDEQRRELERLFEQIPGLERVYHFRWGITGVFDRPRSPAEAAAELEEWRGLLDPNDEDDAVLLEFFATYDAHREGILEYFQDRKTSGPVEGLNNKARVITKRCYGIKDSKTLWDRLTLDVNLASLAVSSTVAHMHAVANQIREMFLGFYT